MALETGLEGRPWYWGTLVGLLVGGAIYFGVSYAFLGKLKAEIQAQDSRLAELQTQLQKGRAAQRKLPQFREEVRRLELELEKLLRVLPVRRNTPQLLRRLRAITELGNFDLERFRPGNFVDKDFYSEWPIAVSLQGTYHNLALLFDRISRFSRIINIENLNANTARAQSAHTVAASFTLKTFVYKEEGAAEAEAVASQEGERQSRSGGAP